MSLMDCIKKTGLDPEEIRIYNAQVEMHQSEGMSPEEAQRTAAESRLKEIEIDRLDLDTKLREHLPNLLKEQAGPDMGEPAEFDPKMFDFQAFQGGSVRVDETSNAFINWAGGADVPVIESDEINDFDFTGEGPFVVKAFHGTTHEFDAFDATKGNFEGQFGAVNYFTSSESDASDNYAGEGPDLTNRIDQRAERLEYDIQEVIDDEGLDAAIKQFIPDADQFIEDASDIAQVLAKAELSGGQDQTLELYVKTEKPFIVGGEDQWLEFVDNDAIQIDAIEQVAEENDVTVEEVNENFEEYEDQVDEKRWDIESEIEHPLVEAIQAVAYRNDIDASELSSQIHDLGSEATSNAIESLMRESESTMYAESEEGDFIGSHLIGEIIQELGYDSIILKNAEDRFGNMNIESGTTHIHVFDSGKTNIKSVENVGTFDPNDPRIMDQPDEAKNRASITFTKDNESIIRLTRASDLSSFLHESGHLFLEMEKRFADKFGQTEEQKVLLDWLGVESFDDIEMEHHEKFAETFEVYLREGKAPSLKLRETFAAFARWLSVIYRKLTDVRLGRAALTPEIRQYMDRMLATEVEIEQAMANPAYDELFKSKEQAGMTDAEWDEYQPQAEKRKNKASVDLNQKLIDELRRRKTAEWKEEREPLISEELERLENSKPYQALEILLKNPINRKLTKEALGIELGPTTAERYAASAKIDLEKDSLLVAAAKKGGLNMDEWSKEGIDPAYMKDRGFNNKVFGRPVFRKKGGMTADDLAEMANELGYGQGLSANDVLELVSKEVSGSPVYTPQGYELLAEGDYQEYYNGESVPAETAVQKTTKVERLIKKVTSKDGVDPQAQAEILGYNSVMEMVDEVSAVKPIKKAAFEAAEERMIEKYGDMLNDGRIELEAREAAHNEEQAKLLLHEIRALSKGKAKINLEYLKAEAKDMIGNMTYKEIKPSKFYRAEIKTAQKAANATDEAGKIAAKTQQIANHYLYREAVDTKERMDKQRTQVRKYETRNYKASEVAAPYIQNIKMLAKSYNMRRGDAGRNIDVERVVSWMITQMDDPNNYVDLSIIDPLIIKMIVARQDGLPVDYTLPEFNDLTANELNGVVDQLKHMRFVGGKLSDEFKNEIAAKRQQAAESITKYAKDTYSARHEVTKTERVKDAFLEFGYSHRRIGGIFENLDGFNEDGPMADEYEKITDASNKELELTDLMALKMNEAFKGVMNEINRFKKETIKKEDGKAFTLSHRARFVLGLNWGNEGNRTALLDGLNAKFEDNYTEKDIVTMLSTMSNQEIDALNKIWAAKELLWPEMSTVEVKRKGVAPAKVEASPFTINGVKLTGGHYRLHYLKDPADTARSEITVDRAANKSIKIGTASSMNERVGSGGRQVDLELGHLFQDISEEIHYISYAELSDHLNSMFKGVDNEIVTSIMKGYGEPYYDNLANTLSTLTQPEDPAKGLWKGLKFVRSNLTYGFLAGSIRNILQQPIAVTNAFSQLGLNNVLKGSLEFYRSPIENVKKIDEVSMFMRNRTALVNREAREQLLKVDAIHPAIGAMKNAAFLPQTFMDSLIAYPTWMGALNEYKKSHPNASEKKAIYYADEMVAKTIGSGLSKDVGAILNKSEAEKQITFMGTFFNLTWNLHVENYHRLKKGDISPMEYAQRLGWMAIAPALLSIWVLDDVPEDDDEKISHMLKEIGYYNMSSLFLVRDLASTMDGFSPSIPGLKFTDGIVRVGSEMQGLMTGDEEFDANTVASIIRGIQPLAPLPASGQIARTLEGMSDPKQGGYGMLVEGKERN